MMRSDFCNASQRHWKDAEYLFADSRLPNADQLYGYSAECGLKCLMKGFGMQFDSVTGDPPPQGRGHIDEVWAKYEAYRTGIGLARYALPANPFPKGFINQRYVDDVSINAGDVVTHQQCSQYILALVKLAITEGRTVV